jgi:Response regulators consisting of a CheY-like receiver domain and a winged-helix DNA-binding domain
MGKKDSRILFVEDEDIIALVVVRAIETRGFAVDRARTGEEALRLFALTSYDLVISDVELGQGIDGTELARRILRQAEIPLLFVTTHPREEVDRRAGDLAGHYEYLAKGFDPSLLLGKIELCLQRVYDHALFDLINGRLEPLADEATKASHEKITQKQREHLRFILSGFNDDMSGRNGGEKGKES